MVVYTKALMVGLHWAHAPNITLQRTCSDVVISNNGQYIYAIGESPQRGGIGYWISTNSGQSFEDRTISSGLLVPNYQRGRTQMSICRDYENFVYVVTVAVHAERGFEWVYGFASSDFGFTYGEHKYINGAYGMMSSDFIDVKASPHNPSVALVGFGSGGAPTIFLTTNGGISYPQANNCGNFPATDINSIDFNPNPSYPNQVVVGCDQGLFMNNNILDPFESCWIFLNRTLSLSQVYRVSSNPFNLNNINIAVTDAGLMRKRLDMTNAWDETDPYCDGTNVQFSKYTNGVIVGSKGLNMNREPLGGCGSNMLWSTNGGLNWNSDNNAFGGYWDGDQDWIAVIKEFPGGGKFYHARRQADDHRKIDFYVSTNGGQTWDNDPSNTNVYPITTVDILGRESPQTLTFVERNPSVMYVSTKNWHTTTEDVSRVYKTIDGGQNWVNLEIRNNGVPNRVVTSIATDPKPGFENYVYLTLSGFAAITPDNPGHVYRSTNGGNSWHDISSTPYSSVSLPDIPVNQMIVRRIPDGKKELIISTDAGVFHVIEGGIVQYLQWKQLAPGLPNSVALGLDFNEPALTLNVATFGRGIYSVNLQGPIYVSNELTLNSGEDGLIVKDDIVVAPGAKLRILNACLIKMPLGKKIIVEDGGQIDVSSGAAVTFTSQSGTWGGIEFQGNAFGTLKNCTFTNTSTPVVINGTTSALGEPPQITIDNCTFNSPIEITNRQNVAVKYCTWSIGASGTDAILGAWSDNLLLQGNNITYISQVSGSHGIELSQCNNSTVTQNTISNADYPITVSNSTYYIRYSNITTNYASTSVNGITLNGVNNGHLIGNSVSGYQTAYWFDAQSSPTVLSNIADASNTYGDKTAIYCYNGSSPRIRPTIDGLSGIIWDAGLNTLRNRGTGGIGIYVSDNSMPDIDYGYNTIFGLSHNITGTDYPDGQWFVQCNNWDEDRPAPSKFSISGTDIFYEPYGCTPPGGGSKKGDIIDDKNIDEPKNYNPPQPIIVNYGNGLIDTFHVSTFNGTISQDQALFGNAQKEVYLGNFESGIDKFKQVIQNYQDSATAIQSMNRIFYCYNRLNADSTAYNTLNGYYLNLANQNSTDTIFSKTAMELSRKCLIRKQAYVNAIGEYENVIQNSQDSSDIIPAEISIIEVYILLSSGSGDAPSYTGQLSYLKPSGLRDAMSKIRGRMKNLNNLTGNTEIPKVFSLSQNYPNPFNPITKINYSLPNQVNVTLKVYDILGRLVKTLVNEFKVAGNYSVSFDGSGLASGVYFYKIEAGEFVQSKKMVLVK